MFSNAKKWFDKRRNEQNLDFRVGHFWFDFCSGVHISWSPNPAQLLRGPWIGFTLDLWDIYEAPRRLYLSGPHYSYVIGFGAHKSQGYDAKTNRFTNEFKRFVRFPADYHDRPGTLLVHKNGALINVATKDRIIVVGNDVVLDHVSAPSVITHGYNVEILDSNIDTIGVHYD